MSVSTAKSVVSTLRRGDQGHHAKNSLYLLHGLRHGVSTAKGVVSTLMTVEGGGDPGKSQCERHLKESPFVCDVRLLGDTS